MFAGGLPHKKKYLMERVPLRIGVKIRPDDEFYGKDAIESYKEASVKLNHI